MVITQLYKLYFKQNHINGLLNEPSNFKISYIDKMLLTKQIFMFNFPYPV